jgi:hypothetical protein
VLAAELLVAGTGVGAWTGGDSFEQAQTSIVTTSMNERCGIFVFSYDGPLDSKSR